jgi:aromatic-amino-acid transaminase
VASGAPKSYLPIDGLQAYDRAVQALVFGPDAPVLKDRRVVTVQALGGTGGLKIGADFLKPHPAPQVWISDPSWENHRALFEAAASACRPIPITTPATRGLTSRPCAQVFERCPRARSSCCTPAATTRPASTSARSSGRPSSRIVQSRGLVPFLDLAYQGFADGIDADAYAPRLFAAGDVADLPVELVLQVAVAVRRARRRLQPGRRQRDEAARALSQVKRVVRTNYSNPPTHGGDIVARVLTTPELRAAVGKGARRHARAHQGDAQGARRGRAAAHGQGLLVRAPAAGLFSYTGLTKEQVERLRTEYSIYAIDTGRVCVAALNSGNIDYVADAIARVIR